MSLRVYINPTQEQSKTDNGVGQVVHAQYRYLHEFDVELVERPENAEIIACHIQQGELPRVDILHCHGLYWTGDPKSGQYSLWHHDANQRIIAAARKAYAVTVPSDWVAEPFRRDMRLQPVVIGHGIECEHWEIQEPQGYVLWNKNRIDDVCDPTPAFRLASLGIDVVSTFGPKNTEPSPTLRVTGTFSHEQMQDVVSRASVYLATTKETFGIGTLEALAAGVPVLGYKWGGTAELIEHGYNGYLVEPGNINGLVEGVHYIEAHREELSANARASAEQRTWHHVIEQYAELYHRIAEEKRLEMHGVSIIITCYNYGACVGEAIDSCLNQTYVPEEIIVVDDGSSDDSRDVISEYHKNHPEIITLFQKNQGVAAARNNGIAQATQPYLVCLDADDKLHTEYVRPLREAMEQDRGLGVAYTGLGLLQQDGGVTPNAWPPHFNFESQATPANPPSNTIPCAAMFRKSMWERAGGYKQVYAPAEDTEFWTRGLSVGFTAKRITEEPLFHYRAHSGSASRTKVYKPIDTWHPWMRDKEFPMGAPAKHQPVVRSYSDPTVSVIIPIGPGHVQHVAAAIDSILGQTFRNWELILVDDTGHEEHTLWESLATTYPFARIVYLDGGNGPAKARNAGVAVARGALTVFLDADDYLLPQALEKMLKTYLETDGKYVYIDWYVQDNDAMKHFHAEEYNQKMWITDGKHVITTLIPTVDIRGVQGFDESLPGFEDWDFYIRLSLSGICGVRLPEPLLVYRQQTGTIRTASMAIKERFISFLRDKYAPFLTGEAPMPGCCGGNGRALLDVKESLTRGPARQQSHAIPEQISSAEPPNTIRMEFIGEQRGAISYIGQPSGTPYRGGNNSLDRFISADPRDVPYLESLGVWKAIRNNEPRQKQEEMSMPVEDTAIFATG